MATGTILVIDDNEVSRKMMRVALAAEGYTLFEAADGRIDLLVTDLVLPGMSGRALWEQITVTHPETRVLFISGYTTDVAVRHGILHSDVPFLQKPFNAAALTQKIRDVLDAPR